MAISRVRTLLPLEEYARIMAIPGWVFNQMTHPVREKRGCDHVLLQSGYTGNPNEIVGRDEIAEAITNAERKIASYLGFFPAPTWVAREQHQYRTKVITSLPLVHTRKGYLISGGVEDWTPITAGLVVNYTDPDGDGVSEHAAFNFATTITDPLEIAVVPPGMDPETREWRIRPLDIRFDAGVCYVDGWTWQFTDPDLWLTVDEGTLGADSLATVDVYRHFNQATPLQAEYRFLPGMDCASPTGLCTPTCQSACMVVVDERVGQFYAQPATWGSGAWVSTACQFLGKPSTLRVWYYSGYRDPTADEGETMGEGLKTAIVRLANCYLPEAPCGCSYTSQRWERDREERPVTTYDVAQTQSYFGTTMAGAVYARSVCASIPPLGQGG